ncbi:MAG: periplasmic protein TonB [Acidobacteriota bacterium]|jgi:protein TonB|nr:periplasmic protein TonB [Acidobacteriota bacterium]
MSKRTSLTLLLVLLLSNAAGASARSLLSRAAFLIHPAHALREGSSEREQDGLAGPVRRVKTETAKISVKNGKPVEGARAVLETTTYDQKGNRVDNAYFLAAGGSLTGKEVYKYDERGNIIEMTLHNDDGTLLAKEVYTYELDALGNWVKMTTAVAVIEGGKVTFEPSEVTYRTISYYLDDSVMAKMSQPQPAAAQDSTHAAAAAQTQVAQPQPVANTQTSTTAQTKPQTPALDAAKQSTASAAPAHNTAAPLLVASLDKGALTAPGVPAPVATNSNASAATGGPAVKADGEAPAVIPVRTGPLKPISGGILNGRALSLPAPAYPDVAKRAHTSGTVEVEVVIDTNGKVISAKAVRGPSLLQQAAEMAARLAKFTPTLLSGQPMKVAGVITYNFSLQQ